MKKMTNKMFGILLSIVFVITTVSPGLIAFADNGFEITDKDGNVITERVEVQEYGNVQLAYAYSEELPEGAYVTWESNLPLLAAVDDNGKVTGYDYSKAAIIQLWLDEEVRSIPIVGEATAKSIENAIESSGVDLETVDTDMLVLIVKGIAGDTIAESLRNYLDNMNTEITATLYNAEGIKIASDKIGVLVTKSVVASVAPTGVHITNKKVVPKTVAVGTTVQLYGACTPVRLKQGIKWSVGKNAFDISSKKYANVSSDGLVTFTAPGTASIRVNPESTAYAAFSDTITFTVVAPEDLPVTDFIISGPNSVQEGSTVTLHIDNLTPAGAYWGDIVWSSSDNTVAIVDQQGTVTGLDGGSGVTISKPVTISATIGDVTRTFDMKVTRAGLSATLSGIEIVGEDALPIDSSYQYISNVFPARLNTNSSVVREWGLIDEEGRYIMATSSSPAVTSLGTIDANGLFTPTASGMSTIVARATLNGNTVETTKSVFSGKPITDFSISGKLKINETKTSQLTITNINPEDYDEQILENIKWTSADPRIATVDEHGLVRGIDGGSGTFTSTKTVDITATVGGISRTVTVTVVKGVVNNLTSAYIDGFDYVIKDFPVKYTSSFSPERVGVTTTLWGIVSDDGQVPFDDSITVSSAKYTSNNYASVSEDGVVTGKNAGSTVLHLYGKRLLTSYVKTAKEIDVVEIEPKSITITPPTKVDYIEGTTELDLTGLKVELTYDRSDIEQYYGDTSELYTDEQLRVSVDDYTVSEINPKILDTEQYIIVTVTRAGKNIRGIFPITLESKKVESIELTNPKYKYLEGETELDLTELQVKANYSNAPSEFVEDYTVDTDVFNPTLYNVEQNIPVTYYHEGLSATATFPVIVYGIPVVSVDTNGYITDEWSPTDIKYTLSSTNELDGVKYYYKTDTQAEWTELADNSLIHSTNSVETYYFKSVNSAGIESEATEGYLAKRDNQTPYFTLEKEVSKMTNEPYKLLINNLVVGISGIKSITVNGQDITGNEYFIVSENDDYEVIVTANNGLSRKQIKTVANIDRDAPVINKIELKHKDTNDVARELDSEEFSKYFNGAILLTVSATDIGIASIDRIEYRLLDENKNAITEEWQLYSAISKTYINPNFKGYVEARAIDKAGNISKVVRSDGFVADGDKPTEVKINAVSKGEAYEEGKWTSDSVQMSVSSYAFSGIYEYLYRIDGGEWQKLIGTEITASETGEHTYEFKTVSYSALESDISSITVRIDRQTPVIRVEFQGTFKRWTGENMTFSFSTLEPSLSGITYYYNDGNGWTEITTGDEIILYDNINANYQFKAVNGAGTESPPSDSYIVMIDTVVPTVNVTPETTELTVDPYNVYMDFQHGESGIKSVTLNGVDITGEDKFEVSKNGNYLITVTGNNLKTSNYLLVVDNFIDADDSGSKPVLQIIVNGTIGAKTGDDITFSFSTPNQTDITYYYDNGNGWTQIEGDTLTLNETITANYIFKAVNKYGIESYLSPTYKVILDKSYELVEKTPVINVYTDASDFKADFTILTNDDITIYQVSLDGENWTNIASNKYSAYKAGDYDCYFRGIDSNGKTSNVVKVSVSIKAKITGKVEVENTDTDKPVVIKLYTFDTNELVDRTELSCKDIQNYSLNNPEAGYYILWAECEGNKTYRAVIYVDEIQNIDVKLETGVSLIGDVDLDGDIDKDDYRLIILASADVVELTPEQRYNADVNGDGAIDAYDSIRLNYYLNGIKEMP